MNVAAAPFDHDYVEKRRVAHRYVKQELTKKERAWFEGHLAICEFCTDEVTLAAWFAQKENASEATPGFISRFRQSWRWLSGGAGILALLVLGFLMRVAPSAGAAESPQVLPATVLWLHQAGLAVTDLPKGPVTIAVEPPSVPGIYRLSVTDLASNAIWTGPVSEFRTGSPAPAITVPALPDNLLLVVLDRQQSDGGFRLIQRYPLSIGHH